MVKFSNIVHDSQTTDKKTSTKSVKPDKEAKLVVLQPMGYPFVCSLIETPKIEVINKELFELYAREQWEGFMAAEGSYLFDQRILPDYAFKIIRAYPDKSKITRNTSILLIETRNIEDFHEVQSNIRMDDVIGQEHAKMKCKIIMKYLEDPENFNEWAPRNVLFYGTPGTGKTMLAKSLANELDVPLYLIKATSLIGDHVGDGARQIHELYDLASKTAPSVIFIDEIDAIGLDRKYQSIRGDVAEIVNSLLTEMDGINENYGVVTIGATNNPSLLDHALRSRFEEEIEFTLPTKDERREMIRKYIETMPLEVDYPIEKLVELSKGMSGRDIKEKILKNALHQAIAEDSEIITAKHIEDVIKGSKKRSREPKHMFA